MYQRTLWVPHTQIWLQGVLLAYREINQLLNSKQFLTEQSHTTIQNHQNCQTMVIFRVWIGTWGPEFEWHTGATDLICITDCFPG